MSVKRHISFFTGKRGGFSHLVPILGRIKESGNIECSIIATDMHMSNTFGNTINQVENHAENVYRIDTMLSSDSKVSRAKSIGIGIIGISQLLDRIKPDLVFVLGDRGEVLAMVISAMQLNIPVAHLFGGDVTQGGVDEPVRHAITKMANIHFASNKDSAERIIKLGEDPSMVHNVGSPILDRINQSEYTPADTVRKKFNLDINKPVLLLLQHSVTWQVEEAEHQMQQTMEAIDALKCQTIAVYPCSDPGYNDVISTLHKYEDRPYLQVYKNIESEDFWGLMNIASALIGNSSAGVMETASFKLPFINIGIRQEGRLRADNVIDVGHDKNQIVKAIETAIFDEAFKKRVEDCISPYGDGQASERIVDILNHLEINENLIKKKMTFL
jgi:GDP/UDP-N,N'-diacetylbacillosamine 2-epimerase (hydrolysing)